MQKTLSLKKMTATALLVAVGIVIPMIMPIRFLMEPVSFTLASHVAVFLGMFISPAVAIGVAVGTTLGFFLGGFPIIIVLRAASHILFAAAGSIFLQKSPGILASPAKSQLFSLCVAVLHALGEVAVVTLFYAGGNMGEDYYARGYLFTVLGLIGGGTIIHSMIDFAIALIILSALSRQRYLKPLFLSANRQTNAE